MATVDREELNWLARVLEMSPDEGSRTVPERVLDELKAKGLVVAVGALVVLSAEGLRELLRSPRP